MSTTKCCPVCKETKPVTAFYRNRSSKDGLTGDCKECRKDRSASRYADRRANGLCQCGEPAAEGKVRCQGCLDIRNARNVAHRVNHKVNGLCRDCGEPAAEGRTYCQTCLDAARIRERLRRYGITPAQREELLAAQGYACKICRRTEPGGHGWHIDHDHACCPGKKSCGKCVRGVLCHGCNTGLGLFNDNPDTLAAAIEYLTHRG